MIQGGRGRRAQGSITLELTQELSGIESLRTVSLQHKRNNSSQKGVTLPFMGCLEVVEIAAEFLCWEFLRLFGGVQDSRKLDHDNTKGVNVSLSIKVYVLNSEDLWSSISGIPRLHFIIGAFFIY